MDGTDHLNSEGRTLKVTRRCIYVYNALLSLSHNIGPYFYSSTCIIIEVFMQCSAKSRETILSAYTHTNTHRQPTREYIDYLCVEMVNRQFLPPVFFMF